VPATVSSIAQAAFSYLTSLNSISLPSTVTRIQSQAFQQSGVAIINIPTGVVSIDDYAFYYCTSLTVLDLSQCSLLTSIGTQVFTGSALTSISIPASVTSIADYAFINAANLASVVFLPPSAAVPSGHMNVGIEAFMGCTALKTVTLSSAVAMVSDYAFFGNAGLTSVICPQPPPTISALAFQSSGVTGCTSSSASASSSPTFIPLQSPSSTLSSSPPSISPVQSFVTSSPSSTSTTLNGVVCASRLDPGCSTATNIIVPATVSSIAQAAFSYLTSLNSISLPSTVTRIQSQAFQQSGVAIINIPTGVVSIDDYAFYYCTSLTVLDLSQCSLLTSIGTQVFTGSALTSISIPASVTSIADYAFINAANLASVVFLPPSAAVPSGHMNVGIEAFMGCTALKTVTLSSAVATVSDYAFFGIAGLTSVICPQPPPTISALAFQSSGVTGCTSFVSTSSTPTFVTTTKPSSAPVTASPSTAPTTVSPSAFPTNSPSFKSTLSPTKSPSATPSNSPSFKSTYTPSTNPTFLRTANPTAPTVISTVVPSITSIPTIKTTVKPTVTPTTVPTLTPTAKTTISPSTIPTRTPTATSPTSIPTPNPSFKANGQPTTPQPTSICTGSVVTITVDRLGVRSPVSSEVFGANFVDWTQGTPFTVSRIGGNAESTYNYKTDSTNRGSDWFFITLPMDFNTNVAGLPASSTQNSYVTNAINNNANILLTVPMTGWVGKDRTKTWSYPTNVFPGQTSNEGNYGGSPQAGSGFVYGGPTGTMPVTWNPQIPYYAYIPIDTTWITAWVKQLQSNHGVGKAIYFSMDNEPMLWKSSHQDVRPNPTTYDDLWTLTVAYSNAVKAAEPAAKIFGPVTWGLCDFYYSENDSCGPGSDFYGHGSMGWIEWYLTQVGATYANTGVKLVDYLDLHYYPQSGEFSADASFDTLRLRSIRELYDPTYRSESWLQNWIHPYPALIPTALALIQQKAPWMKLAITEYSWGSTYGSALAQAEILAIFATHGVSFATEWNYSPGNNKVDAYKMYLNYDGLGGKVSGAALPSVSCAVDTVGSYAIENAVTGKLFVILFNKATTFTTVPGLINGPMTSQIGLHYSFSSGVPLAADTVVYVSQQGSFTVVLPPRSAHLLVFSV